eukprot:12826441-Alexandrium_andersonii.AAC.1
MGGTARQPNSQTKGILATGLQGMRTHKARAGGAGFTARAPSQANPAFTPTLGAMPGSHAAPTRQAQ